MSTYDLVVVGSGAGGMVSAITAARAGLRTLVIEKSPHFGGSTALSGGGVWIPGSRVLAEQGVPDTPERILAYLDAVVGDDAPRARRQAFVEHGPATVEVLARHTPLELRHVPEYADYYPERAGGSAIGRTVEPAPFDATRLGAERPLLNPPAMQAPFPMPVTARTYRWMNLSGRSAKGLATGARALAKGLGGKAAGHEWIAGGQALAAGLRLGLRASGAQLLLETPLLDLVVEDERVVGVVAEVDGKRTEIRAEAGVILAAGGFERNEAMRHEHQSPALDTDWSSAHRDNTGDIHQIGEKLGAALDLMAETWWFPSIPASSRKPAPLLAERSLPGSLMVNGSGRRFFNEAMSYMEAGQTILELHSEDDPHIPAWLIFDQRYRDSYAFGGGILPRQELPKRWYEKGVVHRDDTVAGLAERIGVPAEALVATIDRFNLQARHGRDDDFGKGDSAYDRYYGDPKVRPNPCLLPLERGPFYAVKVVPGDLGTCGGLRADEHARVQREDDSVIEGLYATGNVAANAMGRAYPGAGATIGQASVFGFIAANDAVRRMGRTPFDPR